jgi:hypothetical protein
MNPSTRFVYMLWGISAGVVTTLCCVYHGLPVYNVPVLLLASMMIDIPMVIMFGIDVFYSMDS